MHGAHSFVVFFGRNEISAFLPSLHLPFDETLWVTEFAEVAAFPVDPMEIRHGVDQRETDATSHILVVAQGLGDYAANYFALLALHHEEVGSGDLRLVAEEMSSPAKRIQSQGCIAT